MRISFLGAAKAVTGSMHLLEVNGRRILVDCGLQQGRDEVDNEYLPFSPSSIDAIIVTHAHIDHSGRIPLMAKHGFKGSIYATGMTCRLLDIMLRDSAHIQQADAQWLTRKRKRAGKGTIEPLYVMEDAEKALELLRPMSYGEKKEIFNGIELMFTDAGHMLGSAFAEMWLKESGEIRKIVFSGDIGNHGQPIIRDPAMITEADYVVMESTYGDRYHDEPQSYSKELANIIELTLKAGGNLIIPSFAVGRAQELLYYIREIKKQNLVKGVGNFPVYLDSPLARAATMIFAGDLTGYMDEDAISLVKNGEDMLSFPGLTLCETMEESKALNEDKSPKIIISASGMCDAGRVRHHLKHNLWREESTVLFVGFQSVGSLGRMLLDGAEKVKLFGEEIVVKAKITSLQGLSSHADRGGLIKWISAYTPTPKQVFVVHGDRDVAPVFADTLRDMDIAAHAPDYKEIYDLTYNCIVEYGQAPQIRKKASYESPAYKKLLLAGQQLLDVILRNKGGTNRDLGKFADQIRALIKKWDRTEP